MVTGAEAVPLPWGDSVPVQVVPEPKASVWPTVKTVALTSLSELYGDDRVPLPSLGCEQST